MPNPNRQVIFRLLALLLPLALLGLAELACRLGGYGGYPLLIRRVAADGNHAWYGTSRAGTNSFFKGQHVQGGGMRELQFPTPKPPGTVRILFLGESAIQGFPQPLPLTNGSFLEAMLHDAWHGAHRPEVLNLGATAVAGYPVTHILEQALEHEPDLVVLMVGNNEFYGAYGVVSLPAPARSPQGMRILRSLRGLGLSQWLEARLAPDHPASGALMERMGGNLQIGPDSPLRGAAERNLQACLVEMVRRCTARKVPVIVCTVPTNERDLHPIGRDVEPPLSAEAAKTFEDRLARAEMMLSSDPASAAELAREALGLWNDHARAHYILGRALTGIGRHDEAGQEYVRARDLDTMPWRATTASQDAARAAAQGDAILCDMEAAFRAASPGGSIGWELLDDHVHMSLRGQALFARTLALAMTTLPEPLHVDSAEVDRLPDWQSYAVGLGHSIYTDYLAMTHLSTLFNIPFMNRSNGEATRRFDEALRNLAAEMDSVDRVAIGRWRDPKLHGATERPLEFVVGVYRMAQGDYATAARLFRVARVSVSLISLWRMELSWRLLTCNRHLHPEPTPEDERLGREVIRVGELLVQNAAAENSDVFRYLGLAYNLAGNHGSAIQYLEKLVPDGPAPNDREVVDALVNSYQQLGRSESARGLLGRTRELPAQ